MTRSTGSYSRFLDVSSCASTTPLGQAARKLELRATCVQDAPPDTVESTCYGADPGTGSSQAIPGSMQLGGGTGASASASAKASMQLNGPPSAASSSNSSASAPPTCSGPGSGVAMTVAHGPGPEQRHGRPHADLPVPRTLLFGEDGEDDATKDRGGGREGSGDAARPAGVEAERQPAESAASSSTPSAMRTLRFSLASGARPPLHHHHHGLGCVPSPALLLGIPLPNDSGAVEGVHAPARMGLAAGGSGPAQPGSGAGTPPLLPPQRGPKKPTLVLDLDGRSAAPHHAPPRPCMRACCRMHAEVMVTCHAMPCHVCLEHPARIDPAHVLAYQIVRLQYDDVIHP